MLSQHVLTPGVYPETPYFSACAHHTHREELEWELKIQTTTSSFTGSRIIALPLTNPEVDGPIPSLDQARTMVHNGAAAEATCTGGGTKSKAMKLVTATRIMSNSLPGRDMLGYACGKIVVYSLDPLVGFGSGYQLSYSIMARVKLRLINPLPGFLFPPATPPTVSCTATITAGGLIPIAVHSHGSYLDGGCYWTLVDAPGIISWEGAMRQGIVYKCDKVAKAWQNNSSVASVPGFYVVINPGQLDYIVGFISEADAFTAATRPHDVATGKDLSIVYNYVNNVKFSDRFNNPGTKLVFTPYWKAVTLSGNLEGAHRPTELVRPTPRQGSWSNSAPMEWEDSSQQLLERSLRNSEALQQRLESLEHQLQQLRLRQPELPQPVPRSASPSWSWEPPSRESPEPQLE